ncbi:hypothetical protein GO730_28380 [Spirosoma sp. HMF3257]|uniref:Uncharacterized protein n=1 Tax=Spirosoma telluris TaxID=2183553 RepID=A0A327NW97_9BACT|nr:hypothetical protein [Spirosoma telluris]RAI77118.1 hypothetical protein HMF3257_28320 [Spirosoma telluris]
MTKTTTRLLLAWLFTCLIGSVSAVLAQPQLALTERDKQNIDAAALKSVKRLNILLNTLTVDDLAEEEIETIIKESYTGSSRLFDNSNVLVEDDIKPTHTSATKTEDLKVDEYLNRIVLYYTKRSVNDAQLTIIFSNLETIAPQQTGNSIFGKVFFTSDFKGKYLLNSSTYQPTKRVVDIRAEKSGQYWKVYITRLGFIPAGVSIQETATARPEQVSKPKVPTNLTSTAHPPALQAKTYSPPPAKVVTSSMPTELPKKPKP